MADDKKIDESIEVGSPEWYKSDEYLSHFKDPSWFDRKLVNIECKTYDDSAIQKYVLPDSKKPHRYFQSVQEGIDIFKQWRKMKVNNNEWIAMAEDKKTNFQSWYCKVPNETISGTKGRIIMPYSVPIVLATLSPEHVLKYDDDIAESKVLEILSPYCAVMYIRLKSPMAFVSDRDFIVVAFAYVLPNGEVISGTRSIDNYDKFKGNPKCVRGFVTLDIYHLRPFYEQDINSTVIEYYAHAKLNGSLPSLLVNQFVDETPQTIVSIKKYIEENKSQLSKPGTLEISPFMLSYLGIDIKINIDENDKEDKDDKDDKKNNEENKNKE